MNSHAPSATNRTGTPGSRDQEALDEFFDRAVEALQRGEAIPFDTLPAGSSHLSAAADRLADLARALIASSAPPTQLDGYTVLSELGRGGMAAVYLARQERLGGRPVAVKILPPHVASSHSARARFKSEVLSVAKQRHPGIVQVYDIVEEGVTLAYVMEWVDGRTLAQIIDHLEDHPPEPGAGREVEEIRTLLDAPATSTAAREGTLGETEYPRFVARIGLAVARALDAVHSTGVLHRDVKPSNILLRRDGTPLLSDFGLARDSTAARITVTGGYVGTIAYSAPEQLEGGPLDARSDVYGLGATLYHALMLSAPVESGSAPRALAQIREARPIAALRGRAGLPAPLVAIITRAMANDPGERYTTAAALAEDLDNFLGGAPVRSAQPTQGAATPARASKRTRRRIAVTTLSVATIACAGAAVWHLAWPAQPAGPVKLVDPNGASNDGFGIAVAGSGGRLIVATHRSDGRHRKVGAADVFLRSRSGWQSEARLSVPPEDACDDAAFGDSVILKDDLAIIGAGGMQVGGIEHVGAAYLFGRNGSTWSLRHRIDPVPAVRGNGFAWRTAMDGEILVIASAFWHPDLGKSGPPPASEVEARKAPPLISVYQVREGEAGFLQAIYPEDLRFPESPMLSCDVACGGDVIIVGAGFAHSAAGDAAGKVYIYQRESPGVPRWRMTQTISPDDGQEHDNFGYTVKAFFPAGLPRTPENIHLAVGCPARSTRGVHRSGRVLFYAPNPAPELSWVQSGELAPANPNPFGLYGLYLSVHEDTLAVFRKDGAEGHLRCKLDLYSRDRSKPGIAWTLREVLWPEPVEEDDLGTAVHMWPQDPAAPGKALTLIAGARNASVGTPGSVDSYRRGAAWVWDLDKQIKPVAGD